MAFENPFKNLSKPQKYAVIGGSVLVGGIVLYRHHSSTGSWNPFHSGSSTSGSTSAGTATSIDPITGLAYSDDNATDPITGLTYLNEAQQYGSVAAAEASVSAYGQSTATGSGIAVNPASPAPAGSPNPVVGTSVYTSNAAWAQAVEAGLTDVGYPSTDVATAIGLYLTQQPLTSAEAAIVSTAIGQYGNPPIGQLQIITQPQTKPSPTPTPTPTPKPKPGAPVNIHASGMSDTGAQVSWDLPGGVGGITWHVVNKQSSNGTVTDQFTTNNTIANLNGGVRKMLRHTRYTTSVYGSNSAGNGPTATVSWSTK